jgi:hypothetical protein
MRSGSDGGEEGTTSTGGGDDPEKSPRRRSSWHPSTSRAVSPSSQVRARHRDGDLVHPLHLRRHQFPLHRRGHNPMAVNREQ